MVGAGKAEPLVTTSTSIGGALLAVNPGHFPQDAEPLDLASFTASPGEIRACGIDVGSSRKDKADGLR